MAEHTMLCDASGTEPACVEPWQWEAPTWGKCADNLLATPESLAEKAAYYDNITMRLHFHPQLGWIAPVTLPKQEVECPLDQVGPCYEPTISEAVATWEDVESWHTGENDGLWNGLYMASQAFRYGATKSPEALENLRKLLIGEKWRLEITGVKGLFTRQYIPPMVEGIGCPTDKTQYIPDIEKDDNKWLSIKEDGCIYTVDRDSLEWVKSDVCGLDAYAGWCLLDNVSQDEYAGHMMALGAIWKLVDDPEIKALAASMLGDVGEHLMNNWLNFVDWDGRATEHGKMHTYSFADSPGFLAFHSMDFILMAAKATGRQDLRDFYDKCLVQNEGKQCEGWPYEVEGPYQNEFNTMIMYVGAKGCKSNFNNHSMIFTAIHNFIWFENDPTIREMAQFAFENHFMDEDNIERAIWKEKNPWFNFGFAAMKKLGAYSPHAAQWVEDGICSLKEFLPSKAARFGNAADTYPPYCESRFDGDMKAEFPVPIAERCTATFEWWGDPYDRDNCSAAAWNVQVPTDYLLPYWMGRYYGFISEDM